MFSYLAFLDSSQIQKTVNYCGVHTGHCSRILEAQVVGNLSAQRRACLENRRVRVTADDRNSISNLEGSVRAYLGNDASAFTTKAVAVVDVTIDDAHRDEDILFSQH